MRLVVSGDGSTLQFLELDQTDLQTANCTLPFSVAGNVALLAGPLQCSMTPPDQRTFLCDRLEFANGMLTERGSITYLSNGSLCTQSFTDNYVPHR